MTSILSVKQLNKNFKKRQVLFDVSFDCKMGRIVGLIGPNGVGKTTIMKSVLGLIKSSGSIKIDGKEVSFNNGPVAGTVGALIENPGIYPYLSGLEHLKMFSKKRSQDDINQLVSDLGMSGYIRKRASNYSLGMKQKLGIAMALINNPKLVILDEPMNGLDPQATKELRNLIIRKASEGMTFLISSHLLSELQKLADDVILINKGKIIRNDTMENLLATNKRIAILKTNDDSAAQTILSEAGFEFDTKAVFESGIDRKPLRILVADDKQVEYAVTLLQKNNIIVLDIHHEDSNLETTVLNLMDF